VSSRRLVVARLFVADTETLCSPTDLEVLQLPSSTIIKTPIERFTEKGIISGGIERECDVIIKATGFGGPLLSFSGGVEASDPQPPGPFFRPQTLPTLRK
jgi:cation diffusion facilitator CzcD-associated flavoprotein CzcO